MMNIMREVDEDMHKDMRYGYNMLEPIEMWGLDRFGDSAVYGRIHVKTNLLTSRKSILGHPGAFFGHIWREAVAKQDPKESRPLMHGLSCIISIPWSKIDVLLAP